MSSRPRPRHVGDWIAALFAALDAAEPDSADRVRRLAGSRNAVIGLDTDLALVSFTGEDLQIQRLRKPRVPRGTTDSGTVSDLLRGYAEVGQALADGRIDIRGTADEVMAIVAIIEVLVDAATRIPPMQDLSSAFLAERGGPADSGLANHKARLDRRRTLRRRERELLTRHGLLQDSGEDRGPQS